MLDRIPAWVFPLFLGLLALGLLQRRDRVVAPGTMLGVGLGMATLSLWGVISALGAVASSLLAWAAGSGLALATLAWLWPLRGLARLATPGGLMVRVPGSWMPLTLMMGIFALRFGLGMAAGLGAPVQPGSPAAVAAALALGLMGGGFAARALAVRRAARGGA